MFFAWFHRKAALARATLSMLYEEATRPTFSRLDGVYFFACGVWVALAFG